MIKVIADDLMSWLKCLHIEYISDEFYSELSALDINDPGDQSMIIERAFVPEFASCNEVSRKALVKILDEVATFPEAKVREMLWSAGSLAESLKDYKSFFEKVRQRIAPGES